jgi:hypothetical protein
VKAQLFTSPQTVSSMSNNSILTQLQKNWKILSFDFHVKGYWDVDSTDKSFDLRLLSTETEKEHKAKDREIPFLITRDQTNVIQFDSSSFYEIDRVNEQELILTYFVSLEQDSVVRVFTIQLATTPA